ncbi:MAG: hypothetical protein P0Y49_05020 [Candidatus Pedobacter colombiensis]|uniref:Uncharacterized protein n=1 Tax=Candidatus Pedobacter colombiensis TaxID=3121371 RepID=A0AAJ5W9H4_9SPHI|nr:hypothetical protein [Pedobacter sp.]WEK20497.1 MAG: hypothetical protein P0Y49_05020 [Pedobacter sp.]
MIDNEDGNGRTRAMGVKEILIDRAINKGRIEGLSEGVLLGRHKKALEVALEMKKEGFPIDKIVMLIKLPLEEVEAL